MLQTQTKFAHNWLSPVQTWSNRSTVSSGLPQMPLGPMGLSRPMGSPQAMASSQPTRSPRARGIAAAYVIAGSPRHRSPWKRRNPWHGSPQSSQWDRRISAFQLIAAASAIPPPVPNARQDTWSDPMGGFKDRRGKGATRHRSEGCDLPRVLQARNAKHEILRWATE